MKHDHHGAVVGLPSKEIKSIEEEKTLHTKVGYKLLSSEKIEKEVLEIIDYSISKKGSNENIKSSNTEKPMYLTKIGGNDDAFVKHIVYGKGQTLSVNNIDNDKLTNNTKFRVGSLTKLFTATCLQILENENLIDLNKPVKSYVSVKVSGLPNVSVIDLINHKSGMRQMPQKLPILKTPDATNALKSFSDDDNLFDLSKLGQYSYSNMGYILLGHIIENITKTDYMAAFEKYIFKPAKITPANISDTKMYVVYDYTDIKPLNELQMIEPNFATTAGALCCSITDLLGFAKFIKNYIPRDAYFMKNGNIQASGGIPGGDAKLLIKNDEVIIKLESIGYYYGE